MEENEPDFFILRAHQSRGVILDYAILFERVMDDFIALSFSDNENKRRELMNMIITEGMSFKYKARLVLKIIRKRIPDDKIRLSRFGSLQKNFDDLVNLRNRFAHEITYVHPDREIVKKYAIVLYNYSKDNAEGYTMQDISNKLKFINEQRGLLVKLRQEFWEQ